jgi:CRISPR/Cas system-associated exonuclease Cas4 (RecB family)
MTESKFQIFEMLKHKAINSDRDYSHFHPSEIGSCPRAIQFKMVGIEENQDLSGSVLTKFDNGHSVHYRIQKYFRDINRFNNEVGLASDIVLGIEEKKSSVSFKVNEDGEKIYSNKLFVYGKSGREYPFYFGDKVWIKDFDHINEWTKVTDLKIGDEFYLIEVPFENSEIHLSGHIDGIVIENGELCVLEIKSINNSGFSRLFFNNEIKDEYVSDIRDDKKCFICGKSIRSGNSLSKHLVDFHYESAIPQNKHIVQANAYMNSIGVSKTLFWYENKDNQEILDIIEQIDLRLVEQINKSCHKLWTMIESTLNGDYKIAKKPNWATPESFGCRYCNFNHICWDKTSDNIYRLVEFMLIRGDNE